MTYTLKEALANIVTLDNQIRDFVRSRQVITLEDIREFKYLKQLRRNELSVIQNASRQARH